MDHNTSSLACWCAPAYYIACPECSTQGFEVEGDAPATVVNDVLHLTRVTTVARGCMRCAGGKLAGMLFVDAATAAMYEGVLVVHNDVEVC